MGFKWICPSCYTEYTYNGVQKENATSKCSSIACERYKLSTKIWQHRKVEFKKKEDPFDTPGTPTNTPITSMVSDMIIMANYAINTIKNKKDVRDEVEGTTYYRYYLQWTRIRRTLQIMEQHQYGNSIINHKEGGEK